MSFFALETIENKVHPRIRDFSISDNIQIKVLFVSQTSEEENDMLFSVTDAQHKQINNLSSINK